MQSLSVDMNGVFVASSTIALLSGLCSIFYSGVFEEQRNLLLTAIPSKTPSFEILPKPEEFSCGGGPFSFYMASLISVSCDRKPIDSCCASHDICYESRHLNQTYCDETFCGCLDNIPASTYCSNIAHPGLCLATHVFGHIFHWSANCTSPEDCALLPEPQPNSRILTSGASEMMASAKNL
ncbi:hypothetical protein Ddc_12827 [Ditylenchus destructor]|nr:hypothetical protein Ddc_12827 [Ditylenchus destructor]